MFHQLLQIPWDTQSPLLHLNLITLKFGVKFFRRVLQLKFSTKCSLKEFRGNNLCSTSLMITLSINTQCLALFHQAVEIYGKFYTSDSLLEPVLYWRINYRLCLEHRVALEQTGMS